MAHPGIEPRPALSGLHATTQPWFFSHKNYLRIPKCCEVITYVKVKVI